MSSDESRTTPQKDLKTAELPTSLGGKEMTRNIIFRSTLGLVGLATLILLIGCATALDLSQGLIPCRQDEMEIVDEQGLIGGAQPDSWTVICHGRHYYCGAKYTQDHAPVVNCIQADD